MKTKSGRKVKLHTVYKDNKGIRLPSVTTVLGILGKPALIHWAWKMGVEGIDYRKYRDDKADIGTLGHAFTNAHISGDVVDTSGYTQDQIDLAENCFLKYLDWEKKHQLEPVLLETSLVSEKYRYGGTFDFYGKVDGILTLLDFKTGKGIYDEFFYQLGGYKQLLEENGYQVDRFIILRMGRDEKEGFETKELTDLDIETEIFLNCVKIYHLKKQNGGK